jgi:hypothetical protein
MKTVLPFALPLRLNFGASNPLPPVGVGLLRRCILALVLAMVMCGTQAALAQKPKPAPAPAPQGTIFFARASSTGALSIWGTTTDGSGLTQVLPSGFSGQSYFLAATPSDMVYGTDPMHDRWWLTYGITNYYDEVWTSASAVQYNVPHYDLFAIRTSPENRSVVERVQLTDLFGCVQLIRGGSWNAVPQWSNNSNEGAGAYVVHPRVSDIREVFYISEDGLAIVSPSTSEAKSYPRQLRVPLAASEIQEGWLAGSFIPVGPQRFSPDELDLVLDLTLLPVPLATKDGGTTVPYGFHSGTVAPDGSMYVRHTWRGHYLVDALAPDAPIAYLDNPGTGQGQDWFPQWSPDGQQIVLVDGTVSGINGASSAAGNIFLQAPFAGAATPLLMSSSTTKKGTTSTVGYFTTKWSPDSQHLVVRSLKHTNGTKSGEGLVCVSVANGTVTDLKVDTSSWHVPLRWVSNQLAP